ncbi:MAG: hypothetical protein WCO45_17625 [Pseudanabaena sp. ELA607]
MMIKKILPATCLAIAAQFSFMAASEAATFSLSWTGTGGYKMTGYFSYAGDSNSDNVITKNNVINEITDMSLTFLDPTSNLLASYNYSQLFSPGNIGDIYFNFDIATQTVKQSGGYLIGDGFQIGDVANGISLAGLQGGVIQLSDVNNFSNTDTNTTGTLTTQQIPFDFNPTTGMVALGVLFGANQARKRFQNKLSKSSKS